MYKKASRRTGGSALHGWSTRKQTEPKIDLERKKLATDWDQIFQRAPRRKKHVTKQRARGGHAEAICNGCGYSEGWMQADGVKRPTRLLRCPACGSREVRLEVVGRRAAGPET